MDKKCSFLIAVVALLVSSCYMLAPTGNLSITYRLLPGECLISDELTHSATDTKESTIVDGYYLFNFSMDIAEGEMEKLSNKLPKTYRALPSDDIFRSFGKNGAEVKADFLDAYDGFTQNYSSSFYEYHGYEVMTVLYDGGISLTADKDFAGYSAGENLAPHITGLLYNGEGVDPVISHVNNTSDNAGAFLDIPMDYVSMTECGIGFRIPVGESEIIEESVVFDLKIPVKVVMYLNWLNDKIVDPNAPVPYEEKTLHCTFKTKYRLL